LFTIIISLLLRGLRGSIPARSLSLEQAARLQRLLFLLFGRPVRPAPNTVLRVVFNRAMSAAVHMRRAGAPWDKSSGGGSNFPAAIQF
jgi:hypothetical protein